jgi:hypothetical protein
MKQKSHRGTPNHDITRSWSEKQKAGGILDVLLHKIRKKISKPKIQRTQNQIL